MFLNKNNTEKNLEPFVFFKKIACKHDHVNLSKKILSRAL